MSGIKPPASLEAEQSCLGALLIRPELMDEAVGLLLPEDFSSDAHHKIYQVMVWLYNNEMAVDLVTVSQQLKEMGWLPKVGGVVFLASLSEQVGFAVNFRHYAKIVKAKAQLRRLLDASQQIAGECLGAVEDVDGLLSRAEENIYRIKEGQDSTTAYLLDDIVGPEIGRIERIFERKAELLGVPSGFKDLDYLTGGWQNSDLIILAARPSMGKTALALNLSFHAAKKARVPTAFFSLEQPKEQLVQRLLSSAGQINAARLRSAKMIGGEWQKFYAAQALLEGVPIYIVDRPSMTPIELRSQARRLKNHHKVGLIIVDYLQLMRDTKARSREQEVGGISRSLKALAKELNVPVIAVAQLSREVEKRTNRRPILSDLRESGSIEQDADLVIFIYRDEVYREGSPDAGKAEVRVAKQRNGPVGSLTLTYLAEYMAFHNYVGEEGSE